MNSISLNFIIGLLFLNLLIVFLSRKKNLTIKQYALGGRKFSTITLTTTIVATWISGDYFFITLGEVYTTGLLYALGCLGIPFSLFITGYLFAPRMKEFLGELSIASFMGKAYGKNVRLITVFSGSTLASGYMIVQFKVLKEIFNIYFGEYGDYALLISALTIMLYTSLGGIRHVALMDKMLSFIFCTLIVCICFSIFSDIAHTEGVNLRGVLRDNYIFNLKNFLDISNIDFWQLLLLFTLFAIPEVDPVYFQRIAMCNSVVQIKRSFYLAALLVALILISISFIGFLLFSFNKNLDPTTLVHYVINVYSYTALKDLIFITLIVMSISTIDSIINATSVMIAHDFYAPLNIKINELFAVRISSILLVCVGLFFAKTDSKMLQVIFTVQSFYVPIIVPPFFMKVFKFNAPIKVVYISMLVGFISVLIWKNFFMYTGVDSVLPATAMSFLVMIVYLCSTKINK